MTLKLAIPPEEHAALDEAVRTHIANQPVARDLMARLDRTETLRNCALQNTLEQVQKLATDW
jgi:hypothetical protein